jgi:hypothetical protein
MLVFCRFRQKPAMKRHLPKAVILGLALAAIVIVWWSLSPKQPVYQGERLRRWLRDLDEYGSQRGDAARAAIRAIGSDAVPILSTYLKYHDGGLERRFNAFVRRHSILVVEDDFVWQRRAAQACAELGLVAEAALPALAEAATNSQAPEQVVEALSRMLPKSASIVTNVIVTCPSRVARKRAIRALANACHYPEATAMSLIALNDALRSQDREIHEQAISVLAKLCDGNYPPQVRDSAQRVLKSTQSTERVTLPLAKGKWCQTLVGYFHSTPAPWPQGNCLTFEVNATELEGRSAGMADVVRWRVFNMHAENFHEITKRLGLTAVEAEVVHKKIVRQTAITGQGPAAVQTVDEGDCIITDARIPKEWLRSSPCVCYSKTDWKEYLASYPDQFNAVLDKQP